MTREAEANSEAYERHKAKMVARSRAESAAGRDIGDIPPVENPERRASCERDLRLFCETYLPESFPLEWSDDHLVAIVKLERTVLDGGLFANAMARGSGKTTLIEAASIWAVAYGHRKFAFMVGADKPAAESMLESIKVEIETNDLLAADFPEVCVPIRMLDGINQRAEAQTINGDRTRVQWTKDEIRLPFIRGAAACGAVIRVAGITGRIRGAKSKTAEGKPIRPDLALIDDPQTEESARSPSQCDARERVIRKAILGLAGPGKKIAAMAAVTVIEPGDLAERLLDRERNPEWQGERSRMLVTFPDDLEAWEPYNRIRIDGINAGEGMKPATAYYLKNREALDAGAKASWEARFNPDEASAVQHAMNLYLADPDGFSSEYQNDPTRGGSIGLELEASEITKRLSGLPAWTVPEEASVVTIGVDVQGSVLYYLATAWAHDGSGWVIAYGSEPEQRRAYWTLADARVKMDDVHGGPFEVALERSLKALFDRLLSRRIKRAGGGTVPVDRLVIDANYGKSTDIVYRVCRESPHRPVLYPMHGRSYRAAVQPMSDQAVVKGERRGLNWRGMPPKSRHRFRYVLFDTNFWKTWVAERLLTPPERPASIVLNGKRSSEHEMLADQLTAERAVTTTGRGRTVDEWILNVKGRDNHLFDCLVMAAVAASMSGVEVNAATIGLRGGDAEEVIPSGRKGKSKPKRKFTDVAKGGSTPAWLQKTRNA